MCWIWAMSWRTDCGVDFVFIGSSICPTHILWQQKRAEIDFLKNFVSHPRELPISNETSEAPPRPPRTGHELHELSLIELKLSPRRSLRHGGAKRLLPQKHAK